MVLFLGIAGSYPTAGIRRTIMENGTSAAPAKPKWYWTTTFLIIAILSVGPLALPLLWFNKKYSIVHKVLWTVVVCALTYGMVVMTVDFGKKILGQYREIGLIK